MLSTGPCFFILGVVVALANSVPLQLNDFMPDNMSVTPSTSNTFIPNDGTLNSTTAEWKGSGTPISTTVQPMTTVVSPHLTATTNSNSRGRAKTKTPKTTAKPLSDTDESTGIIILVVIIIIALGFGLSCYCARKRGRRYSVDINSRADDANIPLSNVEPEMTANATTQNGLKTFESADFSTKEEDAEAKVEQKAEEEKAAADPSGESAAPAKSPDDAEDEPNGGVIEQTPRMYVDLKVEEKTDDEGVISNKTSVESLREANENNSNNAGPLWQNLLWDVALGVPV